MFYDSIGRLMREEAMTVWHPGVSESRKTTIKAAVLRFSKGEQHGEHRSRFDMLTMAMLSDYERHWGRRS